MDTKNEDPKDNPLFQLDVVLIFLYQRVGKIFTSQQVLDGITGEIKVNLDDIVLILKKLINDEYVDEYIISKPKDNRVTPDKVKGYSINFNGKLFLKDGGYNLKSIRDAAENEKDDKIISDQMAIQTNIQTLTFWIAFGAIVASAYYFYYLIIPIYDHFFLKK